MHYKIQMKDQNGWNSLGGKYDAATADERVAQFITCFTGKSGREFRIVPASGNVSESTRRFEASRGSKSPR